MSSAYTGTPSTAIASSSNNVVYLDDAFATGRWIVIDTIPERFKMPGDNEPTTTTDWLIDPKPLNYPPNRAQRRAMKKGKRR
jgi:hypothetical protein